MGNCTSGNFLACPEYFKHCRSGSRAEVVCPSHARLEAFNCQLVRLSQVSSVYVVPHTTSIAGCIVIAINQNLGPTTNGNLEDERYQMTLVPTILAEITIGISPRSIEVPK